MPRSDYWSARFATAWAVLFAVMGLAPNAARAQHADSNEESLTTAQLVHRALSDNPELRALHLEWASSLERAEAAGSVMPQPRLSYTAYLLAVETRQGPQRHVVALSQAFPWMRALRDAGDPHVADADASAAQFDAAALQITFDVARAMLEIGRVDELSALMVHQRDVYADVLDHLSAVMPFGGAEHGHVLRTALMVEVLNDRIADLGGARDAQLAGLRARVRWDEAAAIRVAVEPLPTTFAALPSAEELRAAVAARHPGFDVLIARGRASEERAEVAANRALPMPSASIGWGVVGTYDTLPGTGDGGRDVFMLGLSVPLPVFRGQYTHESSANLLLQESFDDRADQLFWAYSEQVELALIRIDEESRRLERYRRDVLPTANDVTEHYAIAIAHGASSHTEYLLAFEQELQLQVAGVNARFGIALETARLDMLTAGLVSEFSGDDVERNPSVEVYGGEP